MTELLLNMSLDQIGSRGGGGGGFRGGARVREGGGMRSEVVSRPQSQVSRPQSSVAGNFAARALSSGSGPMRRQGISRAARETAAPYQRPTRPSDGVHSRLGDPVVAGTRVHVGGLNFDVMDEDIKELFAGVGDLLHCKIDYDRAGRSNGNAVVIFKRREDAENAVSQFHKRTLDGTPMHVEIVEGGGAAESARGGVRGRGGGGGGGGVPTWRGQEIGVSGDAQKQDKAVFVQFAEM
ncbi:unnamed protein product [Ectocarpus sp. CCAP 1310/34]|nr:unnamed protein product [Ectocarpus sp. CCAP 1310/34]